MNLAHRTFTRIDLQRVDGELAGYEAARAQQLLGITATDVVSSVHRETVERLVREIRLARRRIAEGTYGTCVQCGRQIPRDRLEHRSWATTCVACARGYR